MFRTKAFASGVFAAVAIWSSEIDFAVAKARIPSSHWITASGAKLTVTPVSFSQLAGTVDNLTAYLLLERQVGRGGSCDLTVPVFDGRHRYDLQFSDAGHHILSPAEGQKFNGQTQACHMIRNKIAGFYVDKNHEEGTSSGTIWYAHLMPGDLAVPVRMSMETEIGTVALFLSKLHGHGVDLRLMD